MANKIQNSIKRWNLVSSPPRLSSHLHFHIFILQNHVNDFFDVTDIKYDSRSLNAPYLAHSKEQYFLLILTFLVVCPLLRSTILWKRASNIHISIIPFAFHQRYNTIQVIKLHNLNLQVNYSFKISNVSTKRMILPFRLSCNLYFTHRVESAMGWVGSKINRALLHLIAHKMPSEAFWIHADI